MSHGYVKTPSGWQAASAYYIKVDGVWKAVTNTYVKANGVWRQSFPAAPPPPPPPPPTPPPTPPPAPPSGGGSSGLVSCVSIGFYYCNGASVVAGGAVCGIDNGVPFGGCTTSSCCSYWQSLSGNPSNWICGASGSVSQPNCGGSSGGCPTATTTGGTCYCSSADISNPCSPCTSTAQTGPCGNRYTGGQYCGTFYGSSSSTRSDGTCASGTRNTTVYSYSEASCDYTVDGACVPQQSNNCSQTTSGGTCFCSGSDISNPCSPCTSTSQSGPCGNYYTGASVQVNSYSWKCTTSSPGVGVGNCGYTESATNVSASGTGYSTQCIYNNTNAYPACQSTGAAPPPPPPPPPALDCVTCALGTQQVSCQVYDPVSGTFVAGTQTRCITNFGCPDTYGPCTATGSTPPPPPPPPPPSGCTFLYTYSEYRASCGGPVAITVTSCGESFTCPSSPPPAPPPPPPASSCTCNYVNYGTYLYAPECCAPDCCPNIPIGSSGGGSTPPPPPDPGPPPPDPGPPPPFELPPPSPGIKSIGVNTLLRTPDGLVVAGNIEVGDVLLSADIEGFPYEDLPGSTLAAINWSDKNPVFTTVETTVTSITRRTAARGVVINNDLFSDTHYVLVKKGAKALFVLSTEVVMTDKVYNYSTSSWEDIKYLKTGDIPHEVVSIDCEPYDVFYTEHLLVHDSVDI